VMMRVFARSRSSELDHAALLPLEDDEASQAPTIPQHFRLNGSKP
jgi:hypothetical protein